MKQQTDWQFRDPKVPARVCYLLQQGKVNVTDLLLFFVIDALVKPQGNEDGRGCFASNATLAKAANVVPTYVSERLHYLQDMGLVVICSIGSQRYLELEWSRTGEERKALAGEYGKAHRKAYRKMMDNLNSNRDSTKVEGTPYTKVEAPLKQKSKHNTNDEMKKKKDNTHPSCEPASNGSNEDFFPNTNKVNSSCEANDLAVELKELLIKKNRLPPRAKPKYWPRDFAKLITEKGQEHVRRVFNGLVRHFDNRWMVKPRSARGFYEDFHRIEDAIERIENPHPRWEEEVIS